MSVRTRLLLLFFAITAGAVIFIYLYIVPQLSTRLTNERLAGLDRVGRQYEEQVAEELATGASQARLRRLVRDIAQRSNVRVTLLGVRSSAGVPSPSFVIADSDVELNALSSAYATARVALADADASAATGVDRVADRRIGEAVFAQPVEEGEVPAWVAVFSSPLGEVDDNVALIRRQVVIAGLIAIIAALAAGWFAARAHSRRLRRLEAAAEKVAQGDFQNPIPVDSNDEVGQLAMTFNEMQKRLARLDSARREFIANASHELRTPIFSLAGFVELLEEEDPGPEARAEFMSAMRGQIDRLTKLTTDLLDLSKLDSDAIRVRRIAIHIEEFGALVAREFAPAAEQHSSRIDTSGLVDVGRALGDPDRVTQIVRILIANALTHTPPGTDIQLRTARRQGQVALSIADNGVGIEAGDREQLFDRFYTGDEAGGSGLGLAIAKELARRMDGELSLTSRINPTEFTLTLVAV